MPLELVRGFFAQHEPDFAYGESLPAFGLLDKSPNRWRDFAERLESLQAKGEKIKVIFLARHGEGVHNLAAHKYGMIEFISKHGRAYGDDELTWGPDPPLTQKGIGQAKAVAESYVEESSKGMPLPTSFYTSPLQRSMQTLQTTFGENRMEEHPPLILEDLREGINFAVERQWGLQDWANDLPKEICLTDHQRSPKKVIAKRFPSWRFEEGFSEKDERWSAEYMETAQHHADRFKQVLERIFKEDEATCIAVSAHGGTLLCAQHVFGLKMQLPPVCTVLPLVIRQTKPSTVKA